MSKSVEEQISYWQNYFGLQDIQIFTERVSPFQVINESNKRSGSNLVGMRRDNLFSATILHTRKLGPSDIAHELCHVRFPDWKESKVVEETNRLMRMRKPHWQCLHNQVNLLSSGK